MRRRISEVLFWASVWFAILTSSLSVPGSMKAIPLVVALGALVLVVTPTKKERHEPLLDPR